MELLEKSTLNLKLNVVVQAGVNTDEITDFVALTKNKHLAVRFIEEMPFNGKGKRETQRIGISTVFYKKFKPSLSYKKLTQKKSSTSRNFKIDGHQGSIGIIPAFTRTICNDCNRIRITPVGTLKNCLFDDGVFNIRDFIRDGASNEDLKNIFLSLVKNKPANGFIAEASRSKGNVSESMSTIGG